MPSFRARPSEYALECKRGHYCPRYFLSPSENENLKKRENGKLSFTELPPMNLAVVMK